MSEATFDTNILIDALNDVPEAHAELTQYTRRFISRISWIEVLTGAEGFLSYFTMVEVTEEISRRAAMLRAQRKRLQIPDAIILASAQVAGRVLITRNTKDFPAQMPGIRVPYLR